MKASLRGAWVDINGVDANKVYTIACCIAYWLDSMGYGLDFKNELKSLLVSYPQVDPAAMGDSLRIGFRILYGDNFIDKIQIILSVVKNLHYRQAFFLIYELFDVNKSEHV